MTTEIDTTPLIERYRSDRFIVMQGDCRYGMETSMAHPPAVLITDAPYAFWKRITETVKGGIVNFSQDVSWQGNVWQWMAEWLVPTRDIMRKSKGPAWFFTDWHYAGFYLHWARYTAWPMRAIVPVARTELLLCFADGDVPTALSAAAECARYNVQGPEKPVICLRPLVATATAEGHVLDPFCGRGSTLEAAFLEERDAIGWEIEEPYALEAATRCRQFDGAA